MYGNTKLTIMPILPILWVCEKRDLAMLLTKVLLYERCDHPNS